MTAKRLSLIALRVLAILCVIFFLFGIFIAPKLKKAILEHQDRSREAISQIEAQSEAFAASQNYFEECIAKDGADVEICDQFNDKISAECKISMDRCQMLIDEIKKAKSKLSENTK